MPNRKHCFRSFVTISVIAAVNLVLVFQAFPKAERVVDLSLKDLQENRARLREYRGKIVVLNFWATWCGPCREEIPMLAKSEREYGDRGVVFIGASSDESATQNQIAAFISKYQIHFPIWVGATGDDMAKLHLGDTIPATAFIDREGHVAARILGQMRETELKERLDWLINGASEPSPQRLVKHLGRN